MRGAKSEAVRVAPMRAAAIAKLPFPAATSSTRMPGTTERRARAAASGSSIVAIAG
jgi:hypothetical protein